MKLIKLLLISFTILFLFNCTNDNSNHADMMTLEIVSDTVTQLNDIFTLLESGDRTAAENSYNGQLSGNLGVRKNFYPDDVADSTHTELLNLNLKPSELTPGTYTYTNLEGDPCELIIGDEVNDQLPVTLKVYPLSNININYSVETIKVNVAVGVDTWDPVNDSNEGDYTARDPYYVQYFDGKKEDIDISQVENAFLTDASLNLSAYPDITDYTDGNLDTSDSNDYLSISDLTYSYNDCNYGEGVRLYTEDKDGSGNILNAITKEYNTINFSLLWGIYNQKIRENYFSTNSSQTLIQYSVIDVGKQLFGVFNRSEQFIGKSTKNYDGSGDILAYESQSVYYKDRFILWDEYGVKKVSITGSAQNLSGTIKIYKSTRKPDNSAFDLPYEGDYSSLNPDDYMLTDVELSELFIWNPIVWNISMSRSTGPSASITGINAIETTNEGVYSITTENLLIPLTNYMNDDTISYINYSATVIYDNDRKVFRVTIIDNDNKIVATLLNAKYIAGFIQGSLEIDTGTYDVKIPVNGNGGIYKEEGSSSYNEY